MSQLLGQQLRRRQLAIGALEAASAGSLQAHQHGVTHAGLSCPLWLSRGKIQWARRGIPVAWARTVIAAVAPSHKYGNSCKREVLLHLALFPVTPSHHACYKKSSTIQVQRHRADPQSRPRKTQSSYRTPSRSASVSKYDSPPPTLCSSAGASQRALVFRQSATRHLHGGRLRVGAADEAAGVHKHQAGNAGRRAQLRVAQAAPGRRQRAPVLKAARRHGHRLHAPLALALVLRGAPLRVRGARSSMLAAAGRLTPRRAINTHTQQV